MFPNFNFVSFPKFQTHRVVMGAGLTNSRTWKGIRVTRKEKIVSSPLEKEKNDFRPQSSRNQVKTDCNRQEKQQTCQTISMSKSDSKSLFGNDIILNKKINVPLLLLTVNLFPRGHLNQDTSCFVLKENGQGPFCSPKLLLKFHIHSVCFKISCKKSTGLYMYDNRVKNPSILLQHQ